MLQPQYYYNLIDALVYFIAATIPIYFILKLRNTIAVVIVAVIVSTLMSGFISQNQHNAMAIANQPTSKNTQPSPVSKATQQK